MRRLSANALKLIAAVCMTLDHAAFLFLPADSAWYLVLRFLGKLAIPVFCFLVAEGCAHTRSMGRYLLRLGAFALLSHLPFSWMLNRGACVDWSATSVGFTLLCGALAVWLWQRVRNRALALACVLVCIALTFWSDWCFFGALWVWTFWLNRGDRPRQAVVFALLALLRVGVQLLTGGVLPLSGWLTLVGLLCAAPLPLLYSGERGRGGAAAKWAFYVYYPLHMLLLTALYLLLR